jgi:hypothetical protein
MNDRSSFLSCKQVLNSEDTHSLSFVKINIENLNPSQQVTLLISALEKNEDIISLIKGLNNQYKTYNEFANTPNYQAFASERLIELALNALKRNEESVLPSLLNLIRIICRIGNPPLLVHPPF